MELKMTNEPTQQPRRVEVAPEIPVDPAGDILDALNSRGYGDLSELSRVLKRSATALRLFGLDRSLRASELSPVFSVVSPDDLEHRLLYEASSEPVVALSGRKFELTQFDSDGKPHTAPADPNRAIRALKRAGQAPEIFVVGNDNVRPISFQLDLVDFELADIPSPVEAAAQRTDEQPSKDLVQLRFADEHNDVKNLSAAEMASVLQGLVEITSQIHKTGSFGDGLSPEVRVRPPKEGSFIIEIQMAYQSVMDWSAANPEAATALAATAGAAFTKAVQTGRRVLQGNRPVEVSDMADGQVSVKWQDGGTNTMPRQTWDKLNAMPRPTKRAFRKLLTPLSDEADSLEIREGSSTQSTEEILRNEPTVLADRNDYRAALSEPDDTTESVRTFEAEAQLQSVDFQSGEKWRIKTLDRTRNAAIEDREFLRELDNGLALHKNDIFNVTIRETTTIANGRTSRDWVVTEVVRVRNGGLDPNDGQSASS